MFESILLKCDAIKHNKYTNWYINFMRSRSPGTNIAWRDKQLAKREGRYIEYHHVLPKSIYHEHSKNKMYLVSLTAREHFVAHLLLSKMFEGVSRSKMNMAFFKMFSVSSEQKRYVNSRFYNSAKSNHAKSMSELPRPSCTTERKKKISDALKGRIYDEDRRSNMRGKRGIGKPQSENHKLKRAAKQKRKVSICGTIIDSVTEAYSYAKNEFSVGEWTVRKRLFSDEFSDWFFLTVEEPT